MGRGPFYKLRWVSNSRAAATEQLTEFCPKQISFSRLYSRPARHVDIMKNFSTWFSRLFGFCLTLTSFRLYGFFAAFWLPEPSFAEIRHEKWKMRIWGFIIIHMNGRTFVLHFYFLNFLKKKKFRKRNFE